MNSAIESLQQRLAVLEAQSDIRRLLARYMDFCDVPHAPTQVADLAALFAADAIWEGVGADAEQTFGRQQGRQAVAEFVASYLPPASHFSLNLHFLTSELLQVDESASRASGQWIMQQISSYTEGGSELISARLNIDFVCVDGQWYIAHFRTCRLFHSPLGEAAR
ncbi:MULTISPECIES: nuclear transport factor 2 family protein [Pseudomonas]|uniref:nuclear transport factor 2 family protein n=1 Tax=Pseudomonas TaxID=286 RepID=UPI0008DFE576|nr:nuclear transport factor 2 family protein [Pseudomonas marincola]MBQ53968.1 nuclear transport factor 2 family protein [Pseudomonadaceae bacterium]SFT86939.1 SnoaL-like domain-containing protein [Pseudomonas marincola]HCP55417.1 nuclear transport factor 2 family protein [Pseudomonas sp.]